jgi:hypothetical protein
MRRRIRPDPTPLHRLAQPTANDRVYLANARRRESGFARESLIEGVETPRCQPANRHCAKRRLDPIRDKPLVFASVFVVGRRGIEPRTIGLKVRCSAN